LLFRKVVVDGDAQLALRQVADVAHRRDYLEVASEIFVDGLRLRGRFDHDECFGHESHWQLVPGVWCLDVQPPATIDQSPFISP